MLQYSSHPRWLLAFQPSWWSLWPAKPLAPITLCSLSLIHLVSLLPSLSKLSLHLLQPPMLIPETPDFCRLSWLVFRLPWRRFSLNIINFSPPPQLWQTSAVSNKSTNKMESSLIFSLLPKTMRRVHHLRLMIHASFTRLPPLSIWTRRSEVQLAPYLIPTSSSAKDNNLGSPQPQLQTIVNKTSIIQSFAN